LSATVKAQSYLESNPSTITPLYINANEQSEWDFSVVPSGTISAVNYFFRAAAYSAGVVTPLGAVANYAALTLIANSTPNTPTSLTPAAFTWFNYGNPSLSFVISDPDASDNLRYQIQVSTASNFSSLTVDYTSATTSQPATRHLPSVRHWAVGPTLPEELVRCSAKPTTTGECSR
jgi:hypothetical protein